MNKIVCDVCGTSYPETAEQCPICGTAKTDSAKTATAGETGYAYVKGGRFSHANVRKRNAGKKELPRVVAPVKPQKEADPKPRKEAEPKPKKEAQPKPQKETAPIASKEQQPVPQKERPARKKRTSASGQQKPVNEKREKVVNVILALIALLLVLAILAVFAFILKGYLDGKKPTEPAGGTTTQSTASTSVENPCTDVRLALSEKKFTSVGDKFQINAIPTPEDTTDEIWYESADERIATVDDRGVVTAVANGQVIIYVHCGEYTAECSITCEVGVDPIEPTDPTEPSTDPTEPPVELKLNREDFTLNGYGDSHILYNGEIDPAQIIWTSSDETVATVTNGKVVAVGNGNATITAEYMGQKVTCQVHCLNVVVSSYELKTRFGSGSDFTISVGDSIVLYMVEKETGLRIQAEELTFTLSKEGVITIDENGKIKAVGTGTVTVTVTYGEHTLKSTVRVKKAS